MVSSSMVQTPILSWPSRMSSKPPPKLRQKMVNIRIYSERTKTYAISPMKSVLYDCCELPLEFVRIKNYSREEAKPLGQVDGVLSI